MYLIPFPSPEALFRVCCLCSSMVLSTTKNVIFKQMPMQTMSSLQGFSFVWFLISSHFFFCCYQESIFLPIKLDWLRKFKVCDYAFISKGLSLQKVHFKWSFCNFLFTLVLALNFRMAIGIAYSHFQMV